MFCILFIYLFLDRFVFRRKLDDLLFGRPRQWLARKLNRAAERLAGRQKHSPCIWQTESGLAPQTAKTSDLVTVRHYSSGQNRSNQDFNGQEEQSDAKDNSFAVTGEKREDDSAPKPLTIFLKNWRPHNNIQSDSPKSPVEEEAENPTEVEIDDPSVDGGGTISQTITCKHINLILALCKGQNIAGDQRRELYKALMNIRHSMMLQRVVENINGSDQRIKDYLNSAEREFSASAE